jgi:hypothetical protein
MYEDRRNARCTCDLDEGSRRKARRLLLVLAVWVLFVEMPVAVTLLLVLR